jgi:hypothetical protein
MTHHPRKRKLIKTELQLRLVAVFVLLSVCSVLLQVILFNRSVAELSRQMVVERHVLLDALPTLFVENLLLTSAVLVPVTFFVGVLATHRIAGPIHRFERYLASIVAGEEPGECRIREGDELQGLCNLINAAVTSLRAGRPSATPAPQDRREAA